MFNELIVVTVTPFSGTSTPDKNNKASVMLQCIAGTMPNRNVLSGTVAERAGFEVGKSYLVQVREIGTDTVFGQSFNWIVVGEITASEVIDAVAKLGKPEIISIPRPEGFEDAYVRKGDAIESATTKRIKEGLFEPAYPRSVSHKTANEVIAGTTITEARDMQINISPADMKRAIREEQEGKGSKK